MSVGVEERAGYQAHDQLAEQSVLGAMLLSKDAVGDAAELVTAADFREGRHASIFTAVTRLYNANTPADPITVAAALAESGELDRAGGVPYLHDLVALVTSPASVGYYARIVRSRAVLREVTIAGDRIRHLGEQPTDDAAAVVDQVGQIAYDLAAGRTAGTWSSFADLLQPTLDEIEAIASNTGLRGIPTGFADLDRLTNGWMPGQLVIVGARPGLGKSTLGAGDFVRAAAFKHGLATAVFSLEMSKIEITMRYLAAESRVPLHAIRNGQLTDDNWANLARRMGDIGEAPLYVDDTPSLSLMDIRAKARRLKQRHDLKLVVVDYLQLMSSPPSRREASRQEVVAEISRGLKLLGKEIDCPVIAMSQLNRGPETRADKRPNLSDLRESGAVEQDADIVILLHRDDYYDKESPRAGEADLIVAKHRNGPTDTITVASQLHLSRFVDMAIA